MQSIRCGRCGGRHASVTEVRACFNGGTPARQPEAHTSAVRATDRQVDYLMALATKLGYPANRADYESLGKREASKRIDELKIAKPRIAPIPQAAREPYPDVPAGHYAVPSATGNNDLDFYRVDRPTEGPWAGRTFVKVVIGGHPDYAVKGTKAVTVLTRILTAGPAEAAIRYGQEIGRCYRCNRHLTDETSRALGIGPDCRSRAA